MGQENASLLPVGQMRAEACPRLPSMQKKRMKESAEPAFPSVFSGFLYCFRQLFTAFRVLFPPVFPSVSSISGIFPSTYSQAKRLKNMPLTPFYPPHIFDIWRRPYIRLQITEKCYFSLNQSLLFSEFAFVSIYNFEFMFKNLLERSIDNLLFIYQYEFVYSIEAFIILFYKYKYNTFTLLNEYEFTPCFTI